jgi:hypothetical protein
MCNLDLLIIYKKAVIRQYYTEVSSTTFYLEEIVLIGSDIGEFHLRELAEAKEVAPQGKECDENRWQVCQLLL